MARPRPLPSFGELSAYAMQGPMTRRERRAWYRQFCADFRRHDKALEKARQEGTVLKLDVMQVIVDAKGEEYQRAPKLVDGKPVLKDGKPELQPPILLRDLIYQAMGDDGPAGPGMPPPVVDAEEKRRRWRISVEVYAQRPEGELWEVTRDDAEYIQERAAAMLITQAFGFLDATIDRAKKEEPSPPMPASDDAAEETPPE